MTHAERAERLLTHYFGLVVPGWDDDNRAEVASIITAIADMITAAEMDTQRVERVRVREAVAALRGEVVGVRELVAGVRHGLHLHVEADHAELDRRLIAIEAAVPTAADLEEIDRNARAYGFEVGRGQALTAQIAGLSDDNPFVKKGWRDGVSAAPVVAPRPGAEPSVAQRAASLADSIAAGDPYPIHVATVRTLAESLLDIATQVMPDTYLATDARCRLARAVLDALERG
jgi:hypothetical protein